jgi:uncharacterized protein
MKFLLVLAVVLVAAWIWRNNRRVEQQEQQRQPPPARPPLAPPQDMVRCPVCSVHLPRSDALAGPDGRLYCCQEHRLRAGS